MERDHIIKLSYSKTLAVGFAKLVNFTFVGIRYLVLEV
jgi:hypothetical protein